MRRVKRLMLSRPPLAVFLVADLQAGGQLGLEVGVAGAVGRVGLVRHLGVDAGAADQVLQLRAAVAAGDAGADHLAAALIELVAATCTSGVKTPERLLAW